MAHAEVEERQLLKAMTWWDGFVVALANPGFLIAALGGSIGALGTTGAFVLWTISICLGALQNNIHAELAGMFPNKSGGIALYAHEAWRKYLTLIGPLATFGYWIGWSVVLSINGLVAGTLIQAEWFEDSTWTENWGAFDLSLPITIGIGLIILVWAFNVFGVRPAVWFGYVTGGLLILPAFVLMFLPYITGDWSSDNMTWEIGANGGLALALVWLYFMCWSSYGIEVVASFAPEYQDTERDTPVRCAPPRSSPRVVYVLLPLGVGGTLGTTVISEDATSDRVLHPGLRHARRVGSRERDDLLRGGGPDPVDEHRDDGRLESAVRHREGRDDDQGVRRLNRYSVPGRAMTLDAILNIFLISAFAGVLEILAVSNVGYVFATCTALSAFILLRRDRPNWPRPIRLPNFWVPLAGVLFPINLTFLVVGGFLYSGGFLGIEGYGYGWDKTRTGLLVLLAALILYIWRHLVQDKIPLSCASRSRRRPRRSGRTPS